MGKMLAEKTVINDCYLLTSPLGEDSLTERWLATAIYSPKIFILRFLKDANSFPAAIDSLRKSALRTYNVQSNSIADYVEMDVWNGNIFIAAEYSFEMTLYSHHMRQKGLSITQLVHIGISLADALSSFHAVSSYYGNLTAESILYQERKDNRPIVKVTKPVLYSLLATRNTSAEYIIENYSYLAPELKAGGMPSAQSDCYSIGMNLLRCATGILPFFGEAIRRITEEASLKYGVVALLHGGVDESLVRIIMRCLLTKPMNRFLSMQDLISELSHIHSLGPEEKNRDILFNELSLNQTTLASSAYFGMAPVKLGENPAIATVPIHRPTFANITETMCAKTSEEESWLVDDYMEWGYMLVYGKKPAYMTEKTKKNQADNVEDGNNNINQSINPTQKIHSGIFSVPEVAPPTTNIDHLIIEGIDIPVKVSNEPPLSPKLPMQNRKKKIRPQQGTFWTKHRIHLTEITSVVRRSIAHAKDGHGSLRFIEDPNGVYGSSGIFGMLDSFSSESLYFNIGNFARYGTANLSDFAEMLVKSLSFPKSEDDPERIIDRLLSLGTKKKPLFLVVRGGDHVTEELGRIFSVLSQRIASKPIAIAVFFTKRVLPEWHPLSVYNKRE